MKNPTISRSRGGFTLIELMVAMGITAIIITVLVSITGIATDTWTRSRAEIRASRQAKAMLDTMARDFESLVSRRGNNFQWLYAEIDSGAQLPSVSRGGSGNEALALTFLTAATDRYLGQIGEEFPDNQGDVSCVSYRLRYLDPIEGGTDDRTSTFVFYRHLVDPDETFTNLLGQENLDEAFETGGYATEVDEQENFVCENVHQFTLTFMVEVTRPAEEGQPAKTEMVRVSLDSGGSNDQFALTGRGIDTTVTTSGYTAEELQAGRLRSVEISISVLSDGGVIRMNAADGLSEDDYSRNVFHYSRVVELPGM